MFRAHVHLLSSYFKNIVLICLLGTFVQPEVASGQCCTYTLNMHDSYGDGWNGGYVMVYVNGALLGQYSGSGYGSAETFSICEGDSLKLIYTPGMYENENTYRLYSPGWKLVLEEGPDPMAGIALSIESHCDTLDLPGNHPCTALPIDTSQCVMADNSTQTGSGFNPFCADYQGGDMWFVMDIPPSGNVSIQTDSGSLTDTGLAVWTDTTCTHMQLIGCDDDAGNETFSFLSFYELNPLKKLYIQVFGYGGGRGTFRLCANDLGVVRLDSSSLPIISIHAMGQEIPNDPKIDALMKIRYNGPGSVTSVTDSANVYDGHIGIEIRGASSAYYPQRPYSLETRTPDSLDFDVSLLGMPEESDWVLISNFNDRSLIRNTLSFKLFQDMGQYSPRATFCEVLLDSIYKGIYVFGEKIKRDKNRVNIAKLDPEDTAGDKVTGGYILQQNYWNENNSFQSNYSPIDHPGFDVHFVYEYPKPGDITDNQKTYIASFVDSLETVLYSAGFMDPVTGYGQYLDVKSFIDYFLLNEVARNNDGFKKSVFFYKDRVSAGGKIKAGPVWDFDWAWKNINECSIFSATDGSGWAHHINDCPTDNYSCGWYIRLFQDSTFLHTLKCTYEEYRQTLLDTQYIFHCIDSMAAIVHPALERHFQKWPILGTSGPAPEVGPIPTTYEEELASLKSWIRLRLAWLDANIPGLCDISTGVASTEHGEGRISFYPNPTTGVIHFEGAWIGSSSATLNVYDATGRIVLQRIIHPGKISVEAELKDAGIYFFSIRDPGGHAQIGKIIRL